MCRYCIIVLQHILTIFLFLSWSCRQFSLVRVVNVVKRVDGVQGSRYLLELEVKDSNGQLLRLSHYIYTLIRYSRYRSKDFGFQQPKPQVVLCNPVGFRWNPTATVHFIVPGRPHFRPAQHSRFIHYFLPGLLLVCLLLFQVLLLLCVHKSIRNPQVLVNKASSKGLVCWCFYLVINVRFVIVKNQWPQWTIWKTLWEWSIAANISFISQPDCDECTLHDC